MRCAKLMRHFMRGHNQRIVARSAPPFPTVAGTRSLRQPTDVRAVKDVPDIIICSTNDGIQLSLILSRQAGYSAARISVVRVCKDDGVLIIYQYQLNADLFIKNRIDGHD